MAEHPRHEVWPDDLSLGEAEVPAAMLTGHRQVMDAYLLGLAMRHGGEAQGNRIWCFLDGESGQLRIEVAGGGSRCTAEACLPTQSWRSPGLVHPLKLRYEACHFQTKCDCPGGKLATLDRGLLSLLPAHVTGSHVALLPAD